jgi:pyrroline-5-carboxylate reductase
MTGTTIGIVGGCGWIGRALTQGILSRDIVPPGNLILSGRAAEFLGCPLGVRYTSDNAWLASESDVVILSVRPEQFAAVCVDARERLLVSVMAGVPAASLTQKTNATRVIRVMPSAAAGIGRSFTPLYANSFVSAEEKLLVRRICDSLGRSAEVESEAALDYMTGLTGSGPAFVALLADAMLSHAVARGLNFQLAYDAVRTTMEGAGELVGRGEVAPRDIIETLMAYRGTTAAALEAMQAQGFISAVGAGLDAAERRVRTMYPSVKHGHGPRARS